MVVLPSSAAGNARVYISRVFAPRASDLALGVASRPISVGGTTATCRARWPGAMGKVRIDVAAVRMLGHEQLGAARSRGR
jgi:hypothetical protein